MNASDRPGKGEPFRASFWSNSTGLLMVASPTPESQLCSSVPNNPNEFNCNFDGAQFAWIGNVFGAVAIAFALGVLALAVYAMLSGKSLLPGVIERRLPTTPATSRDRRLQGASLGVIAVGLLVSTVVLLLTELGAPGQTAGPLSTQAFPIGVAAVMPVCLGMSWILQFQIRYRDRRTGVVSTLLERIRNQLNPRRAWMFAADGLHWWDGGRWLSTLSPDGAYRWNGLIWTPVSGGPAELLGPVARIPTHTVPTSLTRRIRLVVASWWALQAAVIASMPFWYIRTMSQWADAMNQQNPQLSSGGPPPDLSAINSEMTIAFYVSLAIAFAIAGTAVVGALKGWIWAFYAILIVLGLEAFNLSSSLASDLGFTVLFGQSSGQPDWMTWADLGTVLASATLFVWMLIVERRTGPWAMRRVTGSGITGLQPAGR